MQTSYDDFAKNVDTWTNENCTKNEFLKLNNIKLPKFAQISIGNGRTK